MSSAKKFIPRYTVSDHRLWEGDWELVEGIAISMSPSPFGPHERVVSRLVVLLSKILEDHDSNCEVYAGPLTGS